MAWSGYLLDDLLVGGGLELIGGHVAKGTVEAGAVEPGDVFHGRPAGGGAGGPGLLVEALAFQGREERLGERVEAPIDRQVDLCGLEWFGGRGDWEEPVDLAGHIALEAADDLALGQALSGAAVDVGDGRRVPAHPDHDDPKQRGIGLAVATPVEAVTAGLAGGGRDGAGATQLGVGGLRADPTGVVARGTEQLGGTVEPDPKGGHQRGGGPAGEALEVAGMGLDLLVQRQPPAG